MNGSFAHPTQNHCAYSESSVWILNIGVIIIFIPFLNFCLYPLVRDYMPNMQKRIGIGHILALSSPTVLLTLSAIGVGMLRLGPGVTQSCMFESSEHHHHRHILPINSHYVILPHITISLAEVLVIVSSELPCMPKCVCYSHLEVKVQITIIGTVFPFVMLLCSWTN